jgi:hypothetical protein
LKASVKSTEAFFIAGLVCLSEREPV